MKILITGVAGFIGSQFARWVIDNIPDVVVVGLDDLSCGYKDNVPEEVLFLEHRLGGVNDHLPASECFVDVDYVFHFAAYAAEGRSPFIRRYNYDNNILATAQIVNQCINTGVKRLVFTSSMAVYGFSTQGPPFKESYPCIPIDPYGIAKYACEMDIDVANKQHGLDYCIIRPHNVFGPGQCIWNDYRNVLGIWMRQVLQGKPLRIYGDGNQSRAFSYIGDMLPCLWEAATKSKTANQTINIGGSTAISINEAANALRAAVNDDTIAVTYTEPRHEVFHAYCTNDKAVDLLGYRETKGVYQGMREMWTWAQQAYKDYPDRLCGTDCIPNEITKGQYSFWDN